MSYQAKQQKTKATHPWSALVGGEPIEVQEWTANGMQTVTIKVCYIPARHLPDFFKLALGGYNKQAAAELACGEEPYAFDRLPQESISAIYRKAVELNHPLIEGILDDHEYVLNTLKPTIEKANKAEMQQVEKQFTEMMNEMINPVLEKVNSLTGAIRSLESQLGASSASAEKAPTAG